MSDYEDALLMQCAKAGGIDFIVTRNKKDFKDCPVECLSLEEWVEKFCPDRMLLEAENRMRSAGEADFVSSEEAMEILDITEADLATVEDDC